MGRESYDDMIGPERPRRKAGGARVGLIAVLGVLICAIIVLVILILNPAPAPTAEAEDAESVSVTVREPEVIARQEEGTAPATVAEAQEAESAPEVVATPEAAAPVVEEEPASSTVTASTLRPADTVRTTAVDLMSAQELASFNDTDRLVYLTHTVQEGEDLQSIAASYGRDVDTLISVNRIRNLTAIQPGVSLQIPNMDGRLYTVQEGDMLSTIAQRFSPSLGWQTLMDINGLDSENIRVGQELFIPQEPAQEETSLQTVSLTFSRPLEGTVYATNGTYFNNFEVRGILMTANAGSPVMAAADGVVVDAQRDSQMGRTLVIQHEEGYKTTYAGLETVSASVGDEVSSGQVIGTIGTSSPFGRPTLYFRIEQGGIQLDPALFF